MFLIKISDKNNSLNKGESEKQEVIQIGKQYVTFLYDELLSLFSSSANEIRLIESPLKENTKTDSLIFSIAHLNIENGQLRIEKKVISGRSLYYYISPSGEFYCSTHIHLLRRAGVGMEENEKILPEFFVYRYVTAPNTLYKDVYQMKPGQTIRIQIADTGNFIKETIDFDLLNAQKLEANTRNEDKVGELLESSITALGPVRDRISCLLSGGLDSSILFKMLNKNFKLSTSFSTAYPFEDPNGGETKYALTAAEAFGSEHHHLTFTNEDYLMGFIESIGISEEPLFHLQSVMFNLIFKAAIPSKNIVVSGQGADGFFGLGLHEKNRMADSSLYKILSMPPVPRLLWKMHRKALVRKINTASRYQKHKGIPLGNTENILWLLGNNGDKEWVANYFNVPIEEINKGRLEALEKYDDRSTNDLISLMDFVGDISSTESIWSKIAEGHQKIMYYPFNNEALIKYVMSVPWEEKLKKPKNILRKVAQKNEVPDFIIKRKKKGFYVPAPEWAKRGGIFEPLVPLAAKEVSIEVLRDLQGGSQAKGILFWNFLNYAIWKRLHINNEPKEALFQELKASLDSL